MSVKKTIAIDARLVGGTNTGDSTYWTCLIQALAQQPSEFEFLLISNSVREDIVPAQSSAGCDIKWIALPKRFKGAIGNRFWSLIQFPLLAKRIGADLVHTQYSLSPLIGSNGITTIHDVSFFVGPQWFPKKDRFLLRTSIPSSCRRARLILTVSETSKSEIEEFVLAPRGLDKQDKVRVTPNACPTWIHPITDERVKELLSNLGVKEPYVLTVGTRWPRKNMELAVAAMDHLPADLPHLLYLTGKHGFGPETLGIRGRATGYVSEEELCALYQGASLYLAPSFHEGFGIPVLEAFRLGCPVMCSSGGSLPEVAGTAGKVMSSWDPVDWGNEIQSLLAEPSKLVKLSLAGQVREAGFSWTRTAELTLAAYREALDMSAKEVVQEQRWEWKKNRD